MSETKESIEDALAAEAEELDGYFSDTPLDPEPKYPPLNESFDKTVLITGLSRVSPKKQEKFVFFFSKFLERLGTLAENEETGYPGLYIPLSGDVELNETKDDQSVPVPPEGYTLGFAFVTFKTVEGFKKALAATGSSIRSGEALTIVALSRVEKLRKVPKIFAGEKKDKTPEVFVEKPNATKWLEDSLQRDQFAIRHGSETAVMWSDGRNDPVVDYDGSREKEAGVPWCDYYCHWSPKGSYLATLVPSKGVILWCGPGYEKTARFVAPGVKRVVFSPDETYMLTCNDRRDDLAAIKVYHVATSKLARSFPLYPKDFLPKIEREVEDGAGDNSGNDEKEQLDYSIPPPPFVWSHDGKYLARMSIDLIIIYETPSMRMLENKSIRAVGVREIQWSPKANVLAYWAPEATNVPAHVDLIELPSRKQLRQKNLVNVATCNMVWHPDGDYLAVKVTRHTKSKKTLYNNIELFRLNEPGVPVEMLEIKDAVMALTWEPRGSRFAMIHSENPSSAKVSVSFYDMMKKKEILSIGKKGGKKGQQVKTVQRVPEINKLETLEGRGCNVLFWSPAGQTILMASLGDSASGTLEFYDVDTKALVIKEHYRANQVMWDPAGRTVATCVTQPVEGGHFKFAMDNGYIIWTFQGKQLYQQSFETFYQFVWRPRETLLSKSQVQKVRKNLKSYEKQFEKADKERQRMLYLEETKGKRLERKKYRDVRDELRALRKEQRARHIELLDGYDSEDDENYVVREITVETILSTKEETVA